jgi:hypothetical protein
MSDIADMYYRVLESSKNPDRDGDDMDVVDGDRSFILSLRGMIMRNADAFIPYVVRCSIKPRIGRGMKDIYELNVHFGEK